MRNIFLKIDQFVCRYFGLDMNEIIPHFAGMKEKKLVVLNTESFKRHLQASAITEINLNNMNKVNKEKLGVAVGRLIATNLVVSFEDININRENTHAR